LQLGQALDACVDECRTEGVLEEGDAEEDAHSEREQELDPEEERVRLDKATVANDCTDESSKVKSVHVSNTECEMPQNGCVLTRRARRERRRCTRHQR
jgi:hypothetical protein